MSLEACNNTSVGMIIEHNGKLLLIERKKFPFGFACPAGHVDDGETYEAAAIREIHEEVGLVAENLELVFEGDIQNVCRRPSGSWHHWKVFLVTVSGEIVASPTETKSYQWVSDDELSSLAVRTREYIIGNISEDDWQALPGLEPVWLEILGTTKKNI